MHDDYEFKIATVRHTKDSTPIVKTYTIPTFADRVRTADRSRTTFQAYHFQKVEEKRLLSESRAARASGDMESAKLLKEKANAYKLALDGTKFGPAFLPYVYKDDVTFKLGKSGAPQREKDSITHFSLIALDVESKTSREEIHAALSEYEYMLWTTITHTPTDPRYRVVLFPSQPLSVAAAQALIYRIDAHLPNRNDLSKKTQCVDPVSGEVARLMFFPRWLTNHPERYYFYHNPGKLLTADSFQVDAAIEQAIATRIAQAEHAKAEKNAATLKLVKDNPGHTAYLVTDHNDKEWLNPDAYFETEKGWIQLRDVTTKIGAVVCPLHADSRGSEFLALNKFTGRPQLVCAKCGVFKMLPPTYEDDDDTDSSALVTALQRFRGKASETTKQVRERSVSFDPSMPTLLMDGGDALILHNERHLPPLRAHIPEQGILLVRSPKGTGKTHRLEEAAEDARKAGESVILLTHRIALADNLAKRTGLVNYNHLPTGESTRHMVICVNSLTSRLDIDDSDPYDTVIIDESEQVLRNLLAPTMRSTISDVFMKIVWLLQNAKRIICLDADLSTDMTIELLMQLRGERAGDDYKGIINDYKTGAGKTIKMYADRFHLIADALHAIEQGEKVFIASSTAAGATTLAAAALAMDKRTLLLTSQTIESEEARAFTSEPSAHLLKYDVVVASPTLQTGFSIDGKYFTKVFGHFKAVEGITYQDFDQAISRVRECNDVSVWIQGNVRKAAWIDENGERKERPLAKGEEPKDTEWLVEANIEPKDTFLANAFSSEKLTRFRLATEPKFSAAEILWANTEAQIRYMVAIWSHDRDVQFRALREELGFTVEDVAAKPDTSKLGRSLYKAFSNAGPTHAENIFNARALEWDEAEQLGRKAHRTQEERWQLERWRIQREYDAPITLEITEKAVKQNLLRQLSLLRALYIDDRSTRIDRDRASRERNPVAFTVTSNYVMQGDLLEYLCKAANVDLPRIYDRLKAAEEVEIPYETLLAVSQAFAKKQPQFNHYFGLRIKNPSAENSVVKVWNSTFGKKLSLTLIKKRQRKKGDERMRYIVDAENNSEVIATMERSEQLAGMITKLKQAK